MLKTEASKVPYLKAGDSKYAFICWEPHIFNMNIIITMQNLVGYNAGFFQRQSFKLVATITSRTKQQ